MVVDINKKSILIAVCLLSSLATLIFIMQPYIVGMAADEYGLSDTDIGIMTASYYAGFSILTITAPMWIRRIDWKIFGVLASGIAFVALLFAGIVNSYNSLLISLFGAGCGAAIIFSISNCLVGDMKSPDQKFGLRTGTEQLVGAVALIIIPAVIVPQYGFSGLLISLALLFLIIGPTALALPKNSIAKNTEDPINAALESNTMSLVVISLVFLCIFHLGLAGVWTFLERIGNENGMSSDTITNLLALAALSGFLGPFLAAFLANKVSWKSSVIWGSLIILGVVVIISLSTSIVSLGIAFTLLPGAWFFVISYYMGIVADADKSGKYVVLIAASLAIASALGPLLTGFLRENYGQESMIIVASLTTIMSAYAFIHVAQKARSA